jgi:hypothetical protein
MRLPNLDEGLWTIRIASWRDWIFPPARSGLRRVAGPTQAVGGDDLVTAAPLLERVGVWRAFLSVPADADEVDILRRHGRTGRPLGDDAFVERLEASLGRDLRPRKPGPKPRKTPREPRDR